MRQESKAARLVAVPGDRQAVAVRVAREVRRHSLTRHALLALTYITEFAGGKVDPVEAGKKGGKS